MSNSKHRFITLAHYCKKDFRVNWQRKYKVNSPAIGKPDGFWLSDDSDFGWKEWCKGEKFRVGELKRRIHFRCDTKRWLVIRTKEELKAFELKYLKPDKIYLNSNLPKSMLDDLRFMGRIDYTAIKRSYRGLLITPYRWDCRHGGNIWYYGWDCASACVWDLSTIRRLPQIKVHHEKSIRVHLK